jgi:hypothetical protein
MSALTIDMQLEILKANDNLCLTKDFWKAGQKEEWLERRKELYKQSEKIPEEFCQYTDVLRESVDSENYITKTLRSERGGYDYDRYVITIEVFDKKQEKYAYYELEGYYSSYDGANFYDYDWYEVEKKEEVRVVLTFTKK